LSSSVTVEGCEEMEYINTLIAIDSVEVKPNDISNKQDLISKGVDFSDLKPVFVIDIPTGGAIVRDVKLKSSNVVEVQVTFTSESGVELTPIVGSPTSLPAEQFPTEKVSEVVIKVTKTTNGNAPQDVTLSVTACAEGLTTVTTTEASTGSSIVSTKIYFLMM